MKSSRKSINNEQQYVRGRITSEKIFYLNLNFNRIASHCEYVWHREFKKMLSYGNFTNLNEKITINHNYRFPGCADRWNSKAKCWVLNFFFVYLLLNVSEALEKICSEKKNKEGWKEWRRRRRENGRKRKIKLRFSLRFIFFIRSLLFIELSNRDNETTMKLIEINLKFFPLNFIFFVLWFVVGQWKQEKKSGNVENENYKRKTTKKNFLQLFILLEYKLENGNDGKKMKGMMKM